MHIFRPQHMNLVVNHKKKKIGKTRNTWWLKNILLNNDWVNRKIKEIQKYMKMKTK